MRIEGTAQVFNVFHISNLVGAAGLPSSPFNGTLTTITAASDGGAPQGLRWALMAGCSPPRAIGF